MREYRPEFRENDYIYLLRQAKELLSIAINNKNSSSLIYACLESRIALEIFDLQLIILSVKPEERPKIIKDSKPKNGIDRINNSKGSLKERYQLFFQAVCEVLGINGKYYNFKKSKDLQFRLSPYIHSYFLTPEEIDFDSPIMQEAINIINDVREFIESSITIEDDSSVLINIEIESIPAEDKELLNKWKSNLKMDYDELKSRLEENLILRSDKN